MSHPSKERGSPQYQKLLDKLRNTNGARNLQNPHDMTKAKFNFIPTFSQETIPKGDARSGRNPFSSLNPFIPKRSEEEAATFFCGDIFLHPTFQPWNQQFPKSLTKAAISVNKWMNEFFSSMKVTNRTLNYRPLLPTNIRLWRDWHRVYKSALPLCFSPSRRCLSKDKSRFFVPTFIQFSALKPTIPRIVDESSHLCECLSSTKVRNRTINYRPASARHSTDTEVIKPHWTLPFSLAVVSLSRSCCFRCSFSSRAPSHLFLLLTGLLPLRVRFSIAS
jgi:hypothetical protein